MTRYNNIEDELTVRQSQNIRRAAQWAARKTGAQESGLALLKCWNGRCHGDSCASQDGDNGGEMHLEDMRNTREC